MHIDRLHIGTRTTPDRGTGPGICTMASNQSRPPQWRHVSTTPSVNAGAMVATADSAILHVAHGDCETLTSYRLTDHGALEPLAEQSTGGTNPAHVCFSPSGEFLLVTNHSSGSIASLPIEASGAAGPVRSLLELSGRPGPHRTDQTGSKPHQVMFDPSGRYLFVPDKGLDTLFVCILDEDTGELAQRSSVRMREGSGPRHICFHPTRSVAYVVTELDSTVVVLDLTPLPDQPPTLLQVLTTLDPEDPRDSRAAEILIAPDGSAVYASNRSGAGDRTPGGPQDDTIAVFRTRENGCLDIAGHVSSHGIRPRFMTLTPDGESLMVANERSGTIWQFSLTAEDRIPRDAQLVAAVASPVSLVFTETPSSARSRSGR